MLKKILFLRLARENIQPLATLITCLRTIVVKDILLIHLSNINGSWSKKGLNSDYMKNAPLQKYYYRIG